jgi:glucose/arabinose dehydrogenase
MAHVSIRLCLASAALAASAIAVSAATETTLHVFTGSGGDGSNPSAHIVADKKGNLFGTTYYGGQTSCGGGAGCGTVFEVSPGKAGWTTSTIYSFQDQQDGSYPQSPLAIGKNGALYGTTQGNGNAPNGTVYRLTPQNGAWTFDTIYAFQDAGSGRINQYAPLIAGRNAVYGITWTGGSATACGADGCGTFFRLQPSQTLPWKHVTLFSFPGGDGGSLPTWLVSAREGGAVYVSTYDGSGAIVRLSPPAQGQKWSETVLYRFRGGKDGFRTTNLIVGADGTIYGTAGHIVFALKPPASPGDQWTKSTLFTFTHNGASSLALGQTGSLVGVTFGEFDFGAGTVFRLDPPQSSGDPWSFRIVYSFNRRGPSRNPVNVVFGKDSNLYGALNGGDSDEGAVFELH